MVTNRQKGHEERNGLEKKAFMIEMELKYSIRLYILLKTRQEDQSKIIVQITHHEMVLFRDGN